MGNVRILSYIGVGNNSGILEGIKLSSFFLSRNNYMPYNEREKTKKERFIMKKLFKIGYNFTEGVKAGVSNRDILAGAVMGSAFRGLVTRNSSEAIKGMYMSVAVNSLVFGVVNVITDGVLTEED